MPITYYTEEEYKFYNELAHSFWANCRVRSVQKNKDYYPCIPFPLGHLKDQLTFVYQYLNKGDRFKKINFLDVGCGQCHVLMVAKQLGFSPSGIEYDESMLPHWIHNPITLGKIRGSEFYPDYYPINLGDALDFPNYYPVYLGDALDFPLYSKFQVIYLYVPIQNQAIMKQVIDRILAEIPKDTILIGNNINSKWLNKVMKELAPSIWEMK